MSFESGEKKKQVHLTSVSRTLSVCGEQLEFALANARIMNQISNLSALWVI